MNADALALFSAYCREMKSWEERASTLLADESDPQREEVKQRLSEELDRIHEHYCLPSEWTEHFIVSTPPFFDFDIAETVQKTRNHLVVDVVHKNQAAYPYRFQVELRCRDGQWRVASMWQVLLTGKRIRCPF